MVDFFWVLGSWFGIRGMPGSFGHQTSALEERLDLVAYNLQPHMVSKSP